MTTGEFLTGLVILSVCVAVCLIIAGLSDE